MANNDALITWLMKRAPFKFSIDQYHWPQEWGLPWFDFGVTMMIEDRKYFGQGTDYDEVRALSKAIGEALERYIVTKYEFETSSGIAVHLHQRACRENAIAELIERDAYLCHHLTESPCGSIPNAKIKSKVINSVRDQLLDHDLDLKFGQLKAATKQHQVVLCAIKPQSQHANGQAQECRIGLGCSFDLHDSMERALVETIRYVVAALKSQKPRECISSQEFLGLMTFEPMDHQKLARHPESIDFLERLLSKKAPGAEEQEDPTIGVDDLELPAPIQNAPIYACRASSLQLQQFFFGPTRPSVVNLNRMSYFAQKRLDFSNLGTHPHLIA